MGCSGSRDRHKVTSKVSSDKGNQSFVEYDVKPVSIITNSAFPLPKGVNHKCFINILDVLITIFSFLSEKEWSSGRLVCRAWYSILFTSREEIDGQSISSKVQDKHVI